MDIVTCLERLNKFPTVLGIDRETNTIHTWEGGDDQPTTEELETAWKAFQAEGGLAMVKLREERNQRLAETDYAALSDVTLSDEMKTYRQALRDLPANTSDPANPTWPTKPS